MADAPAPARRLSAAEREQWWRENQHRVDELLHSPDNLPRTGGVEKPSVNPGQYFRDESHKRPAVERGPVIDLRKPKPAEESKPPRPKQPKASRNGQPKKRAAATPPRSSAKEPVDAASTPHWGEWLKGELKRLRMTQRELGDLVGVTNQRINQVLRHRAGPTSRTNLRERIEDAIAAATPKAPRPTRRSAAKRKAAPRELQETVIEGDGLPFTFARSVRRHRIAGRLSQRDLAATAKLPLTAVKEWERGAFNALLAAKLERLAAALGCSVSELFREES